MGLGQRLELRQTTQLVMTPQLQQAIRLLQMSNLELSAFVTAEMERNPLLEVDPREETPAPPPEPEPRLEDRLRDAVPGTAEAELDASRDSLYDEAPPDLQTGWASPGGRGVQGQEAPDFTEAIAGATALRDHLIAQIGLMSAPPSRLALGRLLVDELDEAGYLRTPERELAERYGLPWAEIEAAVGLLQSCDPPGIGARSLAECLALQLAAKNRLDPAMQAVLDHLELLAQGRFDRLMELAGVGSEDMADIVAEIRALDPKPGCAFQVTPLETVLPDILLRRDRAGGWVVELNSETLPRLLVNNSYAARISARYGTARSYISECRASASWLLKTLESRARTILKVASEIVRRQEGFFAQGVSALRPMTLRDVAEAVGMHESTISRVTSGKYLACERGLFELRFFFSTGVASSDGGESLSSTAIRDRIRRLIDEEEPQNILSDDTIVSILKRDGVDIARRTVAKYREAMSIPSSVQRRRLKAGLRPAAAPATASGERRRGPD
ncbi:MAG TPA: RNA polymerase factor sigma-54 [Paracoccaceae bacterium]|nr:RNA polymerase factor sigma-54 [Paracoccaceae bacterium]